VLSKSKYKISIITVCFNAAETIEETIKSVIEQRYDNWEYIIIDAGSYDGTLEIIEKYRDKLAYFVSEKDYGLYHAMNKGLEKVTGDIVGIINADDYYYDDVFIQVANAFEEKDVDNYILWGDIVYRNSRVKGWRENNLRTGAFAPHPSMFCPKNVYNRIGGYKLWYKILADYDFMYRAIHKYKLKSIYLPETIAFFRDGGVASQNIFRSLAEEMIIKVEYGERKGFAFIQFILKLIKNYRKL